MSIDLTGYMDVFAEEAREHLQALNQALLEFEKSPANLELVNVIFRSAHTLKGMSATMGFNEVAELTHKMENLLTPIRQGSLAASAEIIELLFGCLDALQEMLEAHISGSSHAVQIGTLVSDLVRFAEGTSVAAAQPVEPAPAPAAPSAAAAYPGPLDTASLRAAEAAQASGAALHHLWIRLTDDCELRNVRAFMVLRELKQLGSLIASQPAEEQLTASDFGASFDLLLASTAAPGELQQAAASVLEVADVELSPVQLASLAAEAGSTSDTGPCHSFVIDEYLKQLVESARSEGYRVLQAHIQLAEDCALKSARAFMVHKCLEQQGEIVGTHPDVEDIEFERFDRELDFLLLSKSESTAVLKALQGISELSDVQVIDEPQLAARLAQTAPPGAGQAPAAAGGRAAAPARSIRPAGETALKPDTGRPVEKVRQAQTIRVDTERLDGLLNLVGELVIGKTRLTSLSRELRSSELSAAIEQIGHIVFDLQSVVMQTRMVPIETVFNRFPRMIRDLAKSRGKQVELVLTGGETELDRTVIEEIGDPLVHLIRNAVDHGIEEPEVRARLGKPPAGTLTLAAFHEGSHVFVQVRDDGAGIDAERIRRKAVEKGLISVEQAAGLSREQALELIFMAGLSTAEQVTDVSGRGVGMDVVRTSIERLSGEIRVSTDFGVGSVFTVKLPLTLAIVQALLVKIAGEEYAIPLAYIEETLRLRQAQIQKINQQDVVQLRGEILPLVWMHRLLGCRDAGRQDGSWFAIVVRSGNRRAGLIVDETIGQTEIVIKSLGRFLQDCKYIAGGTILGDGTVALILDVAHIVG